MDANGLPTEMGEWIKLIERCVESSPLDYSPVLDLAASLYQMQMKINTLERILMGKEATDNKE